jgi:hypothetical protein
MPPESRAIALPIRILLPTPRQGAARDRSRRCLGEADDEFSARTYFDGAFIAAGA